MRTRVGLSIAFAAVVAALLVPAVDAPAPPVELPNRLTLTDVWPAAARTVTRGQLDDGMSFEPLAFADPHTSVGRATGAGPPGETPTRLVINNPDGVRVLRDYPVDSPSIVAAVAIDDGRVYWLEKARGHAPATTVWAADLTGGEPRLIARDDGDVMTWDSPFDLVVDGGSLHWMAFRSAGGELHSVPVDKGEITVRELPLVYTIVDWPWVATPWPGEHGPKRLLNLVSGEEQEVGADWNQELICTATWCRVSTVESMRVLEVAVMRLDGSDRQVLSRFGALYAVNRDPMLLDRFEVQGQRGASPEQPDTLWLVDVVQGRRVELSTTYTRTFHSDGVGRIWWSSTDNGTPSWHVLDLNSLT